MLVSIILPNYNHSIYLTQRIETIINQTFQDFELIILDDCSTDGSKEIINKYSSHSKVSEIVYNKINSGSTIKQWKKGIDIAKGEWIWIAESDDYSDLTFLQKLVSASLNIPTAGLIYSQSYDVDEKGAVIQSRINWTNNFTPNIWENDFNIKGKDFLKYLYEKNVVPNASACLIKKKYFKIVLNGNDKIVTLKMCGDWFTWLLISDLPNISIAFINSHLNYFRDIQQSTRNHNSKIKRLSRLKEEAIIFNSGTFHIDKTSLLHKNETLQIKWFTHFLNHPLNFEFFKIAKIIGARSVLLFKNYLKFKYSN